MNWRKRVTMKKVKEFGFGSLTRHTLASALTRHTITPHISYSLFSPEVFKNFKPLKTFRFEGWNRSYPN